MGRSLPAAEVPTVDVQTQFQAVALRMRSIKDTHAVACAHAVLTQQYYPGVQVVSLVTKNVRDFGVNKLATVGIAVQRPDQFMLALVQQQPDDMGAAFQACRQSLRSCPIAPRLLEDLAGTGRRRWPPQCSRLGSRGRCPLTSASVTTWRANPLARVSGKRRARTQFNSQLPLTPPGAGQSHGRQSPRAGPAATSRLP